jgi:DNA-binding transcriptional LysR family regulator
VVVTGLGFAIVSRTAVDREVELGRLLAMPLNPPLWRNIYLIQVEERFRSRLVTTFVDFAKQQLKDMAA